MRFIRKSQSITLKIIFVSCFSFVVTNSVFATVSFTHFCPEKIAGVVTSVEKIKASSFSTKEKISIKIETDDYDEDGQKVLKEINTLALHASRFKKHSRYEVFLREGKLCLIKKI